MFDQSRLEALASSAAGDSVTVDALSQPAGDNALHSLLDDDEQPQYLLRGRILDVVDTDKPESDPDRRSRKVATPGSALCTLLTDERVLVVIPRRDGVEQIPLSYAAISRVDTEAAPGGNRRLRVYTDPTGYYIDVSQVDGAEVDAAEEYANGRDSVGSTDNNVTDMTSDEILDAIDRLADLHERGALSEADFERKKSELLDRL
jgi:hypothetical protein